MITYVNFSVLKMFLSIELYLESSKIFLTFNYEYCKNIVLERIIPTPKPSSISPLEGNIIKNLMYTFVDLYLCIHIYTYVYIYLQCSKLIIIIIYILLCYLLYFTFMIDLENFFRAPLYAYNKWMDTVSILTDEFNQFIFIVISNVCYLIFPAILLIFKIMLHHSMPLFISLVFFLFIHINIYYFNLLIVTLRIRIEICSKWLYKT